MGINIITQFRTKPGRSKDLIALISRVLPESLGHDGCVEVCIRQNQDDPDDIISVQQWASRHHYEAYRAWRKKNGVTAAVEQLLTDPINVRYFDDVPIPRVSAAPEPKGADAAEIPKVGSKDALGG
jgi:quinol monooxygenase YgiN